MVLTSSLASTGLNCLLTEGCHRGLIPVRATRLDAIVNVVTTATALMAWRSSIIISSYGSLGTPVLLKLPLLQCVVLLLLI
jgi:hypothetical protein